MPEAMPEQPRLTLESVATLAEALGRPIAPERLADVASVLAELYALEAVFADLDCTAVDPDIDDARWPERER